MSNSKLATKQNTKIGTKRDNGHREQGRLVCSLASCHAYAESWEYDPDWTQEQQDKLEKKFDSTGQASST